MTRRKILYKALSVFMQNETNLEQGNELHILCYTNKVMYLSKAE
jgi:hypothetical protein